jgi:glycosyltransferase involved in cell wall biosynthesis
VQQVEGAEVELHGVALNELERRHRGELERLGIPLGDAVPRARVPELFARSDVLVNNMEAGAPDKVVYEAAAACLPVLASNPVFDELFDGFPLLFDRDSPESLADRLRWFAGLDEGERAEIGSRLRERVAQRHSVGTWADGVLAAAR